MINLPSFFAMFVKHFINIIYFAQVLGWNKIAGYLKHEFFTDPQQAELCGRPFLKQDAQLSDGPAAAVAGRYLALRGGS